MLHYSDIKPCMHAGALVVYSSRMELVYMSQQVCTWELGHSGTLPVDACHVFLHLAITIYFSPQTTCKKNALGTIYMNMQPQFDFFLFTQFSCTNFITRLLFSPLPFHYYCIEIATLSTISYLLVWNVIIAIFSVQNEYVRADMLCLTLKCFQSKWRTCQIYCAL